MDGILIISFGTSYKKNREETINVLVDTFRETFPEIPVYLAFTSRMILKKIYEEEKISIDTVEEALKRMVLEGITRVFIQTTNIFYEIEEDKENNIIINKYKNLFSGGIYIGRPLLKDEIDYKKIFSILFKKLFAIGSNSNDSKNVSRETFSEITARNTAVVLIVHGRKGSKECPLDYQIIKKMGYKNIFVGAVEGYPNAGFVLKEIQNLKEIEYVVLVPFFFFTGKHSIRDIAGDEKSSWKNVFYLAGYHVKYVLKGLGEYSEIRKCYIEHLQQMISAN